MKLSVILPTYNEIGNIVRLVEAILAGGPEDIEIIVVDDNSPDGTYKAVLSRFEGDARVTPVLRTTNRGLANSIRAGLEKSAGEFIIIMDTDFTHDPVEIPRMLHLLQVSEVVIGSRFCQGGSMDDVPHYICSLIYNWLVRIILRTQIQDNLSGFIGITRHCLQRLPFDKIFWDYGDYCFRLLHYAQLEHERMLEMPVQYRTRREGNSKSAFWKLLFSYSWALLKLRLTATREGKANPRP